MDVKAIIAEYDRLAETLDDAALETWLKAACEDAEKEEPKDFRGCCALYNELGAFYRARKEFKKGEMAFRRAQLLLEIRIREEEPEACCCCCGNAENARGYVFKHNADSVDYATTLNNLAGLYRLDGRLDEAIEVFKEAKYIYEANPGAPGDIVASCNNNLGLVYLDQKRFPEALSAFEFAMIQLGDSTDFVLSRATTSGNMAFALAGLNRYEEAAEKMADAAELFRIGAGEDSDLYQVCRNLAEQMKKG